MSRNANFEHGHSPMSAYLEFAEKRPAQATAREIYQNSIPADTGLERGEDGKLYEPFHGQGGMTPSDVMEHKYRVAEQRGIRDDVVKRGVINPLRMVPDGAFAPKSVREAADPETRRNKVPLLWNGQHRLAVMLHHSPDTPIPLEWGSYDDFEEAGPRVNKKYNEKIPTSDKPVTLPKRITQKKKPR